MSVLRLLYITVALTISTIFFSVDSAGTLVKSGKLNGAYTESISIGPEIIQILLLCPQKRILLLSSLSRPIQPDIVNEYLAGTAGYRRVALSAQANRNPVYVG